MPSCRACGASAPDDARFCPTCGSAVGGSGPRAPPPAAGEAPPPPHGLPPPPGPEPPPLVLPAATRPAGVAMLGLWSLASGPVFALVGVAVLAMGPALLSDPQFQADLERQLGTEVPPGLLATMVALMGGLLLLDGLVTAAAGWGFYQRAAWGWGAMAGAAGLWAATGLLMMPVGLLFLAPAGGVLWYLMRPGVKQWFGKARPGDLGMPSYVPPPAPPSQVPRSYHDRIHPERVAGCPDCEARSLRGPGPGSWGPPRSP